MARIRLQTDIDGSLLGTPASLAFPSPLHDPLTSYMGISLEALRCFVGKDGESAISFPLYEMIRAKYPSARFVCLDDIDGVGDDKSKLYDGVYKVFD